MFKVTTEEIKAYRGKHSVGLSTAKESLLKRKLIEHLENGGTAEPVLLHLLRDWYESDNKSNNTTTSGPSEEGGSRGVGSDEERAESRQESVPSDKEQQDGVAN